MAKKAKLKQFRVTANVLDLVFLVKAKSKEEAEEALSGGRMPGSPVEIFDDLLIDFDTCDVEVANVTEDEDA